MSPLFAGADERFSATGKREPLGAPFSGVLDATAIPSLQFLENTIGEASGIRAFRVTLGSARADQRRETATVPIELAAGITSRLMLRVRAPFHTGEQNVNWLLDGAGSTVGANPALLAAGPLALNATLVGGLDSAAARLERLADGCVANPGSDPRCGQVGQELTAVRDLIADTRSLTNAIATTYGGRTNLEPSLFVPRTDNAAHEAIAALLASMRDRYLRYQTESVDEGASPVGAGAPATITELQALLTDSTYGYALGSLTRRYQQGFGDVDFTLSFLVFDGVRDSVPGSRRTPSGVALRHSVAATYRLGTGIPTDPDDPLRVPTGDGQDDVELSSVTDIVFGARFWTTLDATWTTQRAREGIARIPDATGSPFVPLDRRRQARHELGDRLAISVRPRVVLNDYLAIGGWWRWMRQEGERLREIAPFTDGIPLAYDGPDLAAHELGVGFAWSSVGAWQRGRARWPLELQWERSFVVSGEGGIAAATSDRIVVRLYAFMRRAVPGG